MNLHFAETNEDPCGIFPKFPRGNAATMERHILSKSKLKSVWTESQCGDLKVLSETTLDKLALN